MKKIYSVLIFFLLGLTSPVFAQGSQCNSGGCYNLSQQNPSGTFTTQSNGWSLVGNCMVGGNYAIFDVACGGGYEWTTCTDFGGMQAWDVELTLLDMNNNILCYQDNSNRSGCPDAPYLGWTSTYTGQVKVLVTESGCATTTSGCNRMVWRMSQAGGAPTSPIATAQPDPTNPTGAIKVSWSAITGATDYTVVDCSSNSVVAQVTTNEAIIGGLSSGLSYSYKVKACSGTTCCSGWSACAAATTQAAAAPPITDFTSNITSVIEGNDVDFTDLSTNSPNTWGWTFGGGTPPTSSIQNPTVTYSTAGVYSVSLTSSNSYGSDTKTESTYINVLQQGSTSIYIGGLVLYADNITPTGNWRTATGNVRIGLPTCNSFVHFSDDVFIDLSANEITSNCQVSFVGNTGDTTNLLNMPFTYEITGATLTDINNPINGLFRLAKLPVQISNIEFLCDGILIQGYLSLPADISKWTSNPAFGSTSVNATLNQLKITQSNGVEFAGSISVQNIKVANKLKLNYLNLSLNTIDDVFSGSCKLTTPIIGIGGSARISQGKLDQVGLSVSPLSPIPLGTTGLAISTGYGSVQYLSTPPPLEITLGCHVVPATPMSFEALGYLDLSVFYQLGTVFGATGKISIFNHYLAQTGFKVWPNKFMVWGHVGYKKFIEGFAEFSVTKPATAPVKFSGIFGANLKMPPQSMVDSMPAYIRYPLTYLFPYNHTIATCQNYVNTSYLTGFAELNAQALGFSIPKMFYKVQWAGSGFGLSYGINYQVMPAEARYALGLNRSSASIFKDFEVFNSTKSIIIEAQGDFTIPETKLYIPSGDSLLPSEASSYPGISYFESNDGNYACFHIENPALGDYTIWSSDSNDSLKVLRANMPPFIELGNVSDNSSSKSLSVDWTDSDPDDNASISLGLDDDCQGGNGFVVVEEIEENDGADNQIIDYSDVPTGTYYIYAEVLDSIGQYDVSYSDDKFTLITANAPSAPVNLSHLLTDTSIIFTFDKGSDPMDYYLYYTNEQGELDYNCFNIAFGDTNTFEFVNFQAGLYYEFALSAMDSLGKESAMSNTLAFKFTSATINNAPYASIQTYDENTKVGDLYSYQLIAEDDDFDPLTYSILNGPDGMTISSTGLIQWTAVDTQAGYNDVDVLIEDPSGAFDSIRYSIFASNDIIGLANIEFSKVLFQNYGDDGIIEIKDIDLETNKNTIDSVEVNIYSTTDQSGITLYAYETELNSRIFSANFSLNSSASNANELKATYGDMIYASYTDNGAGVDVSNFAYFEEFTASFESNKNNVCSGESISFTDKSFGDNITYSWDFGDGTTSSERHPEKIFELTGAFSNNYDVVLTVVDGEGRSATFTETIVVNGSNSVECDAFSSFTIGAYPSPSNGVFDVTFNAKEGDKVTLKIFNSLGDIVVDHGEIELGDDLKYGVDLSGFAKGMYSIQSTYSGITIGKQILIN